LLAGWLRIDGEEKNAVVGCDSDMVAVPTDEVWVAHAEEVLVGQRKCLTLLILRALLDAFDVDCAYCGLGLSFVPIEDIDVLTVIDGRDHELFIFIS
jgi:hypothetical protein